MNYFLRSFSKTRIVIWSFIWLLILIFSCSLLGLNGYPWKYPSLEKYLYHSNGWQHSGFLIEKLRNTPPDNERITMIGGSTCLEAIFSDKNIENDLNNRKKSFEFNSICSSFTTFTDIAKIIHRIGQNAGKIVILIDYPNFNKSIDKQLKKISNYDNRVTPKYYYLTLPKPIKKILSSYNYNISPMFDYFYFLNEAPREFILGLKAWFKRSFIDKKKYSYVRHVINEERNEQKVKEFLQKPYLKENININFDLLEEILTMIKKNGNDVYLINIPYSKKYKNLIYSKMPNFKNNLQKITKPMNIEYIDFNDFNDWNEDDFWDGRHMKDSGRKKFSEELVNFFLNYENNK